MRNVILYRRCQSPKEDDAEIEALTTAGFVYLKSRTEVQAGDLVVPRFSALPFYSELDADLKCVGAQLINNFSQHQYIADLQNWVSDLSDMTPLTWSRLEDVPDDAGPFVLKGETNSMKSKWATHMFAQNKKEAIAIYLKLQDDSLIGRQRIYIRQYVPLQTYMIGIGGIPITKEFRFFIVDNEVICGNFYWSSHSEELETVPSSDEIPKEFLKEAIERLSIQSNSPRAYALDVAIKADGKPIVIELNDLGQSGLSDNDPFVFYKELFRVLNIKRGG